MNAHANHPAVVFGSWLKARRKEQRVIAREFAGRVDLSPAEYAEVELGVVRWIRTKQQNLIALMLNLKDDDEATYNYKLEQARNAESVEFGELLTREQLTPVRLCSPTQRQMTPATKEAILQAVFSPLT